MNYYELTYLALPTLTKEQLTELDQKIQELVKEGKIDKKTEPVKKNLAYSIKGQEQGFLVSFYFYLTPEKTEEVKKYVKQEPNILRHLLINSQPQKEPKKKERRPKKQAVSPHSSDKSSKVELSDIDKKISEILEE